MNIRALLVFIFLLSVMGRHAQATTYSMPKNINDTVITQYPDGVALTRADQDETLLDVARRFLLGQTEIVRLNPDVDRWLVKKGEIVRLSNHRILPDSPHNGITLNIAEYRMYYYPPTKKGETPQQVMSFAHGVGRQDWKTPLGKTKVERKIMNPEWHPPESIRREHAANGDPLPLIVPAGPHNPLGTRALYLDLPGEYRIHGTDIDKINGIGMQITHGCVRMYPKDVEELYDLVDVGTPVYIVKQPIKVGWLDNVLYVESHPDLEGEETTLDQRFAIALGLIKKTNNNQEVFDFDQQALNKALKEQGGEPIAIYERLPPLEEALVTPETVPVPVIPVPAKPSRQLPGKSSTVAKTSSKAKSLAPAKNSVAAKTLVPAKSTAPAKTSVNPGRKGSPDGYYHGN